MRRVCTLGWALMMGSVGCASIPAQAVRRHLIDAMLPIERADCVHLAGRIRDPSGRDIQSFLLLFGTNGRYFYRTGNMIYFSDGKVEGNLDLSTFPHQEFLKAEDVEPENVAMAVGMTNGPYDIALMRFGVERWLASLEERASDGIEFTEARVNGGRQTEIELVGGGFVRTFVFKGSAMVPKSLTVFAEGRSPDQAITFEFSDLRYPATLPDVVFQPNSNGGTGVGAGVDADIGQESEALRSDWGR